MNMNAIDNSKQNIRRIDCTYAAAQSFYWISNCIVNGFLVIYLTYRGVSDTRCGLTSSAACFLAILMQFVISDFLDKHMQVPIRRMIMLLMVVSLVAMALAGFLPLPVLGLLCAYAVSHATSASNNGFLNAQMMQFNNVGIQAHYSWPRGIGSLAYAIASFVYGLIVERCGAGILPTLYVLVTAGAVVMQLLMQNPYKGIDPLAMKQHDADMVRHTSYPEMMRTNPTLMVFLICVCLYSIGQTAGYTFMIRIVENLGGGTVEYGISEFIRAGMELPALLLTPVIYKKITARTGVGLAMLFGALKVWIMVIAPNLALVYAGSALNMLVTGLYVYASVVFVNSITRMTEKVRAQSLMMLVYSIGSIIGSAMAGVLIDAAGLGVMYALAGAFSACGGLVMFLFCKTKKERN